MLPHTYERPVAVLLVLGGLLTCFAGYRLFRVVLALYGFVLGAMIASSTMGVSSTTGMVAAACIGGIVGALVLVFTYFVAVGLAGAGLGALAAHAWWGYFRHVEPPVVAVIGLALVGAAGAMLLRRHVIIVATSFAGAWTLVLGGLALAGDATVGRAAAAGDVWILYPLAPAFKPGWVLAAWVGLGLAGVFVQLMGRRRR